MCSGKWNRYHQKLLLPIQLVVTQKDWNYRRRSKVTKMKESLKVKCWISFRFTVNSSISTFSPFSLSLDHLFSISNRNWKCVARDCGCCEVVANRWSQDTKEQNINRTCLSDVRIGIEIRWRFSCAQFSPGNAFHVVNRMRSQCIVFVFIHSINCETSTTRPNYRLCTNMLLLNMSPFWWSDASRRRSVNQRYQLKNVRIFWMICNSWKIFWVQWQRTTYTVSNGVAVDGNWPFFWCKHNFFLQIFSHRLQIHWRNHLNKHSMPKRVIPRHCHRS